MKKIIVIGSGFSSLAASCYLAKSGFKVTILEKNSSIGGRARKLEADGFYFDMGPTWYWMPDVFERFFADFNKKVSDYYTLQELNPGYTVYFGKNDKVVVKADSEYLRNTFEQLEKGSAVKLDKFLKDAEENYNIAIKKIVYKPGISPLELITPETAFKADAFLKTIRGLTKKLFKNPKIRSIIEFPVLFLGAKPQDTPSFYNFMNYADLRMGTWYPKNGMYDVVKGISKLADELGVKIICNADVKKIDVKEDEKFRVITQDNIYNADIVVSGADYAHTEKLLPLEHRNYSDKYWEKKTYAPSALLFYLGINKKLQNLTHHTLFFDEDFDAHAHHIYDHPQWTPKPLFYCSFPSMTDVDCVPDSNHENATILVPLAPGLEDTPEQREKCFNHIIERLEKMTNQSVKEHIIFKQSYCVNDFVKDYNSYKGNAYGMANTLMQTAFMRPKLKNKKLKNMYYTGQLTVPGPGVPPSLISGKLVSELVLKNNLN